MKNHRIILILLILVSLLLSGCGPHKNPDTLQIGETCELYTDGKLSAKITYNACTEEIIAENESVLIIETITIVPQEVLVLTEKDFLLGVGYEVNDEDNNRYSPSEEYNILKNGYDILNVSLAEETVYKFCFEIPFQKNNIKYCETGVSLLIFHSYSLVYSFAKQ